MNSAARRPGVRPVERQRHGEEGEVDVAPRDEGAHPLVERRVAVDRALGAALEDAGDGPVGHVDPEHPERPLERRGGEAAAAEGVAPGHVPEGRVDDVECVVEDQPELRRLVGEPGELAVHRVEHAHQVRQGQARKPGPRCEQRERGRRREPADAGDPVRVDAPARQRPHHHPDEGRVDVTRQEVGGALVVRPEQEVLDAVPNGRARDSEDVGSQRAPQHRQVGVEVALRQLLGHAPFDQVVGQAQDRERVGSRLGVRPLAPEIAFQAQHRPRPPPSLPRGGQPRGRRRQVRGHRVAARAKRAGISGTCPCRNRDQGPRIPRGRGAAGRTRAGPRG